MATIPGTPFNFYTQQGNGQAFISWDIVAGATSYNVQRSTDGVNYSNLAAPTTNNYLDTAVTIGQIYYYQVASVNTNGTSTYTVPQSLVPSPSGELSLGELRTRCKQRADRLNSNFVTVPEWNFFINQAMFELYDLLITTYENYYLAPPITFSTNGNQYRYDLPNGSNTFQDDQGNTITPPAFYKLTGVDLALQTATNAFVTVHKFNFIDRNKFVYPNTASTIYGVFNLRYRVLGSQIEFIPTPSGNQKMRLWYVPRLTQLLQDTDITTSGISGWLQYVIVRAAKYALDKEESDTSKLDAEVLFLKTRVEESASNRDEGQPDTISDTGNSSGWGFNGPFSGFKGGM